MAYPSPPLHGKWRQVAATKRREILVSRLCHFQRHKSGKEKEKKSGNTRKPLVFLYLCDIII